MEGYKQIIIVCYMKLERPFSGFLFAVLCVCACMCDCPSTCDIGTVIILFTRYLLNLVTQFFKKKKNLLAAHKFHDNWLNAHHTLLKSEMNFCLCLKYLLTSVGKIWYKRISHLATDEV